MKKNFHRNRVCSCGVCQYCQKRTHRPHGARGLVNRRSNSHKNDYFDYFKGLENGWLSFGDALFEDGNNYSFRFKGEGEDSLAGDPVRYSSTHIAARIVEIIRNKKPRPDFLSGEIVFPVLVNGKVVQGVDSKSNSQKCNGKTVGKIRPDIVYKLPGFKLVNLEVDFSRGSLNRHRVCHLEAMNATYRNSRKIPSLKGFIPSMTMSKFILLSSRSSCLPRVMEILSVTYKLSGRKVIVNNTHSHPYRPAAEISFISRQL